MVSGGYQAGEGPYGREQSDGDHDDAAEDRRSLELSFADLLARAKQGKRGTDRHCPAECERQQGKKIFTEKHRHTNWKVRFGPEPT